MTDLADTIVEVYQDDAGLYHYQAFRAGTKNARLSPMLCGAEVGGLHRRAWFDVGDPRGKGYYERACEGCAALMVY